MKHSSKTRIKRLVSLRVIYAFAVIALLLSAALLSGATQALFRDHTEPLAHRFTAGTVKLSKPTLNNNSTALAMVVPGCEVMTWTFRNEGKKTSYVRVRLWSETGGGESIWNDGTKIHQGPGQGSPARYFSYEKDSGTQELPVIKTLGIGQVIENQPVGNIRVWNDGDTLYVELSLDSSLYSGKMEKSDLYVGPTSPTTVAPGSWTYDRDPHQEGEYYSYTYIINDAFSDNDEVHNEVFIASHADVYSDLAWAIWDLPLGDACADGSWIQGGDGWWYYSAPVTGLTGEVSICFKVCDGGRQEFYLEAEAVQASNEAVDIVWPGNPIP